MIFYELIIRVAHMKDLLPFRAPRNRTLPMALWNRRLLEHGIRRAHRVVAQTADQAEALRTRWGREADLIFPNVHPIPPEPEKPRSPLQVVWVANVKPMKRPEVFLDLAERLAGRRDVEFVMIGRPEHPQYQARVEARLRELPHVRYLGEQPLERVDEVLTAAHVFVNTSRAEGFPNTFIQAWMRAVPVVTLEVDPDRVLERKRVGLRSGTLDRLVDDVARLLDDPRLRAAMGRRARAHAVAAHGLDRHIGRLERLLREAAP
jgi:glycosyltransferase involved in cell wall biosynthesis